MYTDIVLKHEAMQEYGTAEVVLATGREKIKLAKHTLAALVSAGKETSAEEVLRQYNALSLALSDAGATASLLSNVHPDTAIRAAAETIEQEVSQCATDISLNRDLYDMLAAINTADLDAESKRLVEKTLRDFRRSGVDKDEATRARIKQLQDEIVKIGQEFERNIREDVRAITLDSVEDLAGLPEDYIASHQPGADGKIRITTDYPDSKPFMAYAHNGELRRQLSHASKNRAYPKNIDVFKRMLSVRHELATTLGYAHWADFVTEDKMIGSGSHIGEFIERLYGAVKEKSAQELSMILEEKRTDVRDATSVEEWEYGYYEERLKIKKFAFDSKATRPYFEYAAVKQGILDLTSELFGLRYEPVTVPVWHEQVEVFDVYDASGKRGRFFLDMHPRDNKFKHAAQFTIQRGINDIQYPESALVCNFTDPKTAQGPALMEHYQVTTFFHEFGHLLHSILGGNQRFVEFSGVATEWDFVEAPSQLFEEWAWEPAVLQRFATHVDTGESIPAELIRNMRKADNFGKSIFVRQQVFYTSLSYHYYNQDPTGIEPTELLQTLQARYAPFAYVPDTHFQYNFGHLDGYSAMYYTYMWSLVIAKDIVYELKKHGLMNTEWTMRYRMMILEPGGSKDAADLVKDFLGREYTFDAFQHWLEEGGPEEATDEIII